MAFDLILFCFKVPHDVGGKKFSIQIPKQITTVRHYWSCLNSDCSESTTKCNNGVCDTSEKTFKSDNYEPDIPKVDFFCPVILFNFTDLFENFPKIDLRSSFDSSGLAHYAVDQETDRNFWSNTKLYNRKCLKDVCETTTKICIDENCTVTKRVNKITEN